MADGEVCGAGDDDLLLSAARGDCQAFQQLVQRHARPMLALARRVLGSAEDADEVVQESFLKAWSMAPGWQPNGAAKFSTWLHRVVLNASLDHLRRKPFAPLDDAGEIADPTPSGLDQAVSSQCNRIVCQALDDLPIRQKEVLTLYYFGEVSGREAAQILDLSLSACEALLARGKRGLRKALGRRGITQLGDVA